MTYVGGHNMACFVSVFFFFLCVCVLVIISEDDMAVVAVHGCGAVAYCV